MQKNLLITAIDTNIGKTYLVEQICQKIPNINVIKPIISGFNFDDTNNDIFKIAKSLNIEYNLKILILLALGVLKKPLPLTSHLDKTLILKI